MTQIAFSGLDAEALAAARASGLDHAGAPIVGFVDAGGGWPLRCCLTDSVAGDELAVISWSPYPWDGAYRELGPVVIHLHGCQTPHDGRFPEQFEHRPQIVRPYSTERRIAYDHLALVAPGDGLQQRITELLRDPGIEFVQMRNALAGCYSFTARRSG